MKSLYIFLSFPLSNDLVACEPTVAEKDVIFSSLTAVEEKLDSLAAASREVLAEADRCPDAACRESSQCSVAACADNFDDSFTCEAFTDFNIPERKECGCHPGQLQGRNRSSIHLAHDTSFDDITSQAFVCSTRKLDDFWRAQSNELVHKQYVSDLNGISRVFPGEVQRDRNENQCADLNVRNRPWFVSAVSGPKNVLVIIDVSGSMWNTDVPMTDQHNPGYICKFERAAADTPRDNNNMEWPEVCWSLPNRFALLLPAVNTLLNSFSANDNIAVMLFWHEVAMVGFDNLVPGTPENVFAIQQAVQYVEPINMGATFWGTAFKKAFELLAEAMLDRTNCRNVLIFLTDGSPDEPRDQVEFNRWRLYSVPFADNPIDGTEIVYVDGSYKFGLNGVRWGDAIVDGQAALPPGQQAHIFTYTVSASTAFPKQISCANDGIWTHVTGGEDPTELLSRYYIFIQQTTATSARWVLSPVSDSDRYLSVSKSINTASAYGQRTVAVTAVDVPLKSIAGINWTDRSNIEWFQNVLTRRSQECVDIDEGDVQCRLQLLREMTASESLCEAPAPSSAECTSTFEVVSPGAEPGCSLPGGLNDALCSPVKPEKLVQQLSSDASDAGVPFWCCNNVPDQEAVDIVDCSNVFQILAKYDTDDDLRLTIDELLSAFEELMVGKKYDLPPSTVALLIQAVDMDGDNILTFHELYEKDAESVFSTIAVQGFAFADYSKNGLVTIEEIADYRFISVAEAETIVHGVVPNGTEIDILGYSQLPLLAYEQLFLSADINSNGLVSLSEYSAYLRNLPGLSSISDAEVRGIVESRQLHEWPSSDGSASQSGWSLSCWRSKRPDLPILQAYVLGDSNRDAVWSRDELHEYLTSLAAEPRSLSNVTADEIITRIGLLSYRELENSGLLVLKPVIVQSFALGDINASDGLLSVFELATRRGWNITETISRIESLRRAASRPRQQDEPLPEPLPLTEHALLELSEKEHSFDTTDTGRDGRVSTHEFAGAANISLSVAQAVFSSLDTSVPTQGLSLRQWEMLPESDSYQRFAEVDTNSDGFISEDELEDGLQTLFPEQEGTTSQTIIQVLDTDGDGHISWAEFLTGLPDDISIDLTEAPTSRLSTPQPSDEDKVTSEPLSREVPPSNTPTEELSSNTSSNTSNTTSSLDEETRSLAPIAIGAGVGVSLLLVIVAILVFCCCCRGRRRQPANTKSPLERDQSTSNAPFDDENHMPDDALKHQEEESVAVTITPDANARVSGSGGQRDEFLDEHDFENKQYAAPKTENRHLGNPFNEFRRTEFQHDTTFPHPERKVFNEDYGGGNESTSSLGDVSLSADVEPTPPTQLAPTFPTKRPGKKKEGRKKKNKKREVPGYTDPFASSDPFDLITTKDVTVSPKRTEQNNDDTNSSKIIDQQISEPPPEESTQNRTGMLDDVFISAFDVKKKKEKKLSRKRPAGSSVARKKKNREEPQRGAEATSSQSITSETPSTDVTYVTGSPSNGVGIHDNNKM